MTGRGVSDRTDPEVRVGLPPTGGDVGHESQGLADPRQRLHDDPSSYAAHAG